MLLAQVGVTVSPRGELKSSLSLLCSQEQIDKAYLKANGADSCQKRRTPRFRSPLRDDLYLEKSGFGYTPRSTRFTRLAAERVGDCAAIIERRFSGGTYMATLTLTGHNRQAIAVVEKWSGYIVQLLKQWLRDNCPGSEHVGVWERHKSGALHLHIVIGTNWKSEQRILKDLLPSYWIRLEHQLERRSGINMFCNDQGQDWRYSPDVWRNSVEPVRLSVVAYLSKYLSKESRKQQADCDTHDAALGACPSRWWFVSRRVQREADAATLKYKSQPVHIHTARAFILDIVGVQDWLCGRVNLRLNKWDRGWQAFISYVNSGLAVFHAMDEIDKVLGRYKNELLRAPLRQTDFRLNGA
jgi:hypothetical protein